MNNKEPELYNSRVIDTYLKYIRKKYHNKINETELLNYCGIKSFEVKDEDAWFTQTQINKFHEKLVKMTGNENIAIEAGRFAASPEALGYLRETILSLKTPLEVYKFIGEISPLINRSSKYESKAISDNEVEIYVSQNENVREKQFQCKNRIGNFEAVPELFGLKRAVVEQKECLFKNSTKCVYSIRWDNEKKSKAKDQFERKVNQLKQYSVNYNHSKVIKELGKLYSEPKDISNIADKILQIINKYLKYERIMIWLITNDQKKLLCRANIGLSEHDREIILFKKNNICIEHNTFFQTILIQNETVYVQNILDIQKKLSNQVFDWFKASNMTSFIISPINHDGKTLGCLLIDSNEIKILERDINFITGISAQIAGIINSYLENIGLIIQRIRSKDKKRALEIQKNLIKEELDKINEPNDIIDKILKLLQPEYIDDEFKQLLNDFERHIEENSQDESKIVDFYRVLQKYFKNDPDMIHKLDTLKKQMQKNKEKMQQNKEKIIQLEARQDFITRAIHNIRNPTEAAHTFLETIKRDFDIEPDVKKNLDSMERQLWRIEDLTSKFLIYTKPLKLRLKRSNIAELINEVELNFSELPNGLKFVNNLDDNIPEFDIDYENIKWSLEELFTNSKKYGATLISVIIKDTNDVIFLSIEDNGSGIKDEFQHTLFDPFISSDAMSTGLGLFNIKKIIEENKGKITYDPNFLKGTRFCIELPKIKRKDNL